MLSAEHRLRTEREIKILFEKGKRTNDPLCGLKFRPNGLPVSRFAVVVGKTVSKRAVQRNRLRRRIREILRKKVSQLKPGFDVAFIVRTPALGKSYPELEQVVDSLLKRSLLFISSGLLRPAGLRMPSTLVGAIDVTSKPPSL